MKIKKLSFILIGLVLLTGCANKNFAQAYNKMQVNDSGINGYTLDLRIYGTNGSVVINELARVENYKDTNYKITTLKTIDRANKTASKELYTYIISSKTYIENNEGKYVLATSKVNYSDPAIYLDGLKSATQVGEKTTKKIASSFYTVYHFSVTKKVMTNILKNTIINDIKITNDVTGEVYIDSKGYVYRIIYNVNDITVNANYFGINNAVNIVLPN